MAMRGRIQTWELLFQKFENADSSKVIEFYNDSWDEVVEDEKHCFSEDIKEKVNAAWRHDTTKSLRHFPEYGTSNIDPQLTYIRKNSHSYRSDEETISEKSNSTDDSDDDWESYGSDLEETNAKYFQDCEKKLPAAPRRTFKTQSSETCRRRKKFCFIDHTKVKETSHAKSKTISSRKLTYLQDCRKKRSSFVGNYSGPESNSPKETSATHSRLEKNPLSSFSEEISPCSKEQSISLKEYALNSKRCSSHFGKTSMTDKPNDKGASKLPLTPKRPPKSQEKISVDSSVLRRSATNEIVAGGGLQKVKQISGRHFVRSMSLPDSPENRPPKPLLGDQEHSCSSSPRKDLPTKTNTSDENCSTLNDLSFSTRIGRLKMDSPSSLQKKSQTSDSKGTSLPSENDEFEIAEAKSERLMSLAHRKRKNSSPGEKSERSLKLSFSDCKVVLERLNVTRTTPDRTRKLVAAPIPELDSFKAENLSRLSGRATPTINETGQLCLPSRNTSESSGRRVSLDSSILRKKRSRESTAYRALMKGKSLFDI